MGETPAAESQVVSETTAFAGRVPHYRERVERELERWLSQETVANTTLADAMRYAVLDGGKRIRPLLAYASGELLRIDPGQADAVAAAVELIHAYSLVHDDLPSMDDDELRRGRPTVHVAFGEATAILVGDALQALAFQVLTRAPALQTAPAASASLVSRLAAAAGAGGMVGGQALDLAYSGREVSQPQVEDMFSRKTGRLIAAAITMPLDCARPATTEQERSLCRFSELAGLCFQIHDDILDVTGTTEQLGKPSGSDVRNDRSAYPARFGLTAARARANQLLDDAGQCLDALGPDAEGLRWLTEYIVKRDR